MTESEKLQAIKDLPTVSFYGLKLFGGSKEMLLDFLTFSLSSSNKNPASILSVYTPNPEQMVLAWEDPAFLSVLQRGDILLPDGNGVVWAANRQQTHNRVERIAGREVFHDLLLRSKTHHWKVFLLGGRAGAAARLAQRFDTIVGFDDGPKEDSQSILRALQAAHPDIVCVAYGAPWQEQWVDTYRQELTAMGVRLTLVVGGAFEYEAGMVPPVSVLVQRLRLEWLQRLILEPWRWKRQLKGLLFFWKIQFHSR